MNITSKSERLGKQTIRWQPNKEGGFSGAVIAGGKMGEIFHDENEERLLAKLRNEAGRVEPNYFGMDEAITRFLEFMPGGFSGERIRQEREYKLKAHEKLNSVLTAERAAQATDADARKIREAPVWINLLSPYESMHLKDALEGPSGAAFLRAAAKFAEGDINAGSEGMRQAMKRHGPFTWPIATYFPFLWDPHHHMFLKPTVTHDFAERIGHRFQYDYDPVARREVYESLLDLAECTRVAIAELKPRDNIDVQSFIWVVGGYTDADLPQTSA
jgi:hypothetical protein